MTSLGRIDVSGDPRAAPDEAWIERVRARWPVEPTLDLALTRKLRNRAVKQYVRPAIEEVRARLVRFLAERLGGDISVEGLRRMTGGASQEQYAFVLGGAGAAAAGMTGMMVLRREPWGSTVATHRLREFQLLRAVAGELPAPAAHFVDPEGAAFERPAMICGFVTGVQKPRAGTGNVSGIGIGFPPSLRGTIGPAFVRALARQRVGAGLGQLNLDQVSNRRVAHQMHRLKPGRFAQHLPGQLAAPLDQQRATPPDARAVEGVLVAVEDGSEQDALETLGRQVGMHVAASRPEALDIDAVDPAALEREKAVLTEQARQSGKPENIIEKMVEGRIRKYYEEVVLLEQVWVHDGESRVRAVVQKSGGKLVGFARFALGEGVEKAVGGDFASEVASVAGIKKQEGGEDGASADA